MKANFRSVKIARVKTLVKRAARLMLIPALVLGISHLNAQSGALGNQFPLYVHSNGNGSIVKLDSSGNQTLFVSAALFRTISGHLRHGIRHHGKLT